MLRSMVRWDHTTWSTPLLKKARARSLPTREPASESTHHLLEGVSLERGQHHRREDQDARERQQREALPMIAEACMDQVGDHVEGEEGGAERQVGADVKE